MLESNVFGNQLDDGRVEALGTPEDVLTTEMIRKVYGAAVRTELNPVSQKPHIIISAGANDRDNGDGDT